MSLEDKIKGVLKTAVSAIAATPAYVYLHEYCHAAAAKLYGLQPKVHFFEKIDGVFTLGEVNLGICPLETSKEMVANITAAPYALTPLGAYLVIDGIKEKSAVKTGIGLPILLNPLFNFIHSLTPNSFGDMTRLSKMHFFTPNTLSGMNKLTSLYHTLYGHDYAYAHPLVANGRIQDTPFKAILENLDKIDLTIGVAVLYAASFGIAYAASKLKGRKKKKETAANGSKLELSVSTA